MDERLGYAGDEINPYGRERWVRIVLKEFGKGHAEVSASRWDSWAEPDPHKADDDAKKALRGESDNRADNIDRSARRARAAMRERCKAIGARFMVTLTTREVYTVDEFYPLFKKFLRRVRQHHAFHYVAVPEPQERGATHLHIAVPTKQNYRLLWSIWLGVCGEGNGRVHVTKGFAKHQTHRIACYMSKYLGKSFEAAELGRRRYYASTGVPDVEREVILLPDGTSDADVYRFIGELLTKRGYRWSYADAVQGLGDCLLWMHVSPERHFRGVLDPVVTF